MEGITRSSCKGTEVELTTHEAEGENKLQSSSKRYPQDTRQDVSLSSETDVDRINESKVVDNAIDETKKQKNKNLNPEINGILNHEMHGTISIESAIENASTNILNHLEQLAPTLFIGKHPRTIKFASSSTKGYQMITDIENQFLGIKNEINEANKLIVLFGLRDKSNVDLFVDCAKSLKFLDGTNCPVRLRSKSERWNKDIMAQAVCTASFPYVLSMFESYTDCPLTFKVVKRRDDANVEAPNYIIYADSYGPAVEVFGQSPVKTRSDIETFIIMLYESVDADGNNVTEAYGLVSVVMEIPNMQVPMLGNPIKATIARHISKLVRDVFTPVINSYLKYINEAQLAMK